MTPEEGQALLAENAALKRLVGELQEQVEVLTGRVAELEKKGKPPSWAKASRAKKEGTKTRKKRVASHNQARRREEPTRIERHAVERCAGCGYHLRGESEAYRRQVIELPEPQPVEVIEHQIVKRWCPVCAAWQQPAMDWSRKVVGQGRIGVRLGGAFHGHLVSDFYGGYNIYRGPHQRCWVHLLRDLKQRRDEQQADGERLAWALAVHLQYQLAQEAAALDDPHERRRQYDALWQRTQLLGLQYAQVKNDPCQALAKRLLRHIDELYQFVLHPAVPADNNLAERALRPLVVQRKVSGGTRSPAGSQTRFGLASLFHTWQARRLNPYHEFLNLLLQPAALSPSVSFLLT